ncbi:PrsW family intramembrane metalloprotease [Georgenia wangjunii]|uniref:PrsW family intramembrane metalloprotease n=1 Tax=Georgenia wangjunii TaxID=3117730 RepID=UPI002F266B89
MSGYTPGLRPSEPYPPSRTVGAAHVHAGATPPPWGQGAPPGTAGPRWPEPASRRGTPVWGVLAVVLVGIVTLVSIGQIADITGSGAAVAGGVVALVPLVVVLLGIRWVDRWEPEPRLTLLFALLWGAGVATLVSLVLNTAVSMAVYATTGDVTTAETVGAVVSAPLVEESAKGLGVLLILLARRRYFDGPVDGIVYAATVGAGFAFVENILYFGESIETLPAVFIMRGIMSPFAHVIFTAAIGVALGLASRSRSRAAWVLAFPAGWFVAVVLHALWNGSAVAGTFFALYGLVQVPLFVGVVVLVLWLRRQERGVIGARLGEYAAAGWFAPHEVAMLTSFPARRRARAWASGRGAGAAMTRFQRAATELAFARQRAATGRADLRQGADERALLERVTASRHEFAGAAARG